MFGRVQYYLNWAATLYAQAVAACGGCYQCMLYGLLGASAPS